MRLELERIGGEPLAAQRDRLGYAALDEVEELRLADARRFLVGEEPAVPRVLAAEVGQRIAGKKRLGRRKLILLVALRGGFAPERAREQRGADAAGQAWSGADWHGALRGGSARRRGRSSQTSV